MMFESGIMMAPDETFGDRACSDTALVLAAHGSSDDPSCAAPVVRLVDRIRAMDLFGEVVAVFWKQSPRFSDTGELTTSARLVVVPVMTAGGYYATRVLPRELHLNQRLDDRDIVLTRAIGELDAMSDLIIAQAIDAASEYEPVACDTHLLLVGHGTRREAARSGATTHYHASRIEDTNTFRSVHAAFLEQDPSISDTLIAIPGGAPVIVVPFLIADGTHALTDIRAAAGAPKGSTRHQAPARTILFANAVGERDEILDLVLHAALETTAPERRALGVGA